MNLVLTYVIPISVGIVFLVLMGGIYTMFRGGEFSRTWSNKMMRLRVVTQFVVVLLLCAALYYKDHFLK